jgi:hypothetical protein
MDVGAAAIIAGVAAIVGALIGALAGLGGAWLQARSTRDAARETDGRKRDAEAKDRIRAFRVRAIDETRSSLGAILDWYELCARGRTEEAEALDKQFWSPEWKLRGRVMNLSLLGDDGLTRTFLEMRRDFDTRVAGSAPWTPGDVERLQNMRVLVMGLLDVQERAALADEPPFAVRPPGP